MKSYITSLLLGLVVGFLICKSYNDLYYKSTIEDYQKILVKKQEEIHSLKSELLQSNKELQRAYEAIQQFLQKPTSSSNLSKRLPVES